jgi:small-conductance mechanosensitive channel
MTNAIVQNEWFIWAISLVVGFPLLSISLGEAIHALQKGGKPLAAFLQVVRNLLIPVAVLMLFLKYVLELGVHSHWLKIVETLFWICTIHTALSLMNVLLFAEAEARSWRSRMPKLLIDLTRLFLIGLGTVIVLSVVWGANLAGLVTALGVSSLVFGLALQDTLGSIMSGIALLFERPFSVGDWLKIGETIGQVIDINWRAVRLQTRDREMVVIPHKLISGQIVHNFSQPQNLHAEHIILGFSYDHPPNSVKQILLSTATSTPGVLLEPEPEVRTLAYGDFEITYDVVFFIENYQNVLKLRDRVMTRIWYAAQRNNLTLPYPTSVVHRISEPPFKRLQRTPEQLQEQFTESLQSIPAFVPLAKNRDALGEFSRGALIQKFAVGEKIVRAGEASQALYIIVTGRASISIVNQSGKEEEVLRLSPGEFFGEMTMFTEEPSPVSIMVVEDLEAIAIYSDVVDRMIESQPSLAREIGQIIEARRRAIQAVQQGKAVASF